MFVLHIDTFRARAVFAPRSRVQKKTLGASLRLRILGKQT